MFSSTVWKICYMLLLNIIQRFFRISYCLPDSKSLWFRLFISPHNKNFPTQPFYLRTLGCKFTSVDLWLFQYFPRLQEKAISNTILVKMFESEHLSVYTFYHFDKVNWKNLEKAWADRRLSVIAWESKHCHLLILCMKLLSLLITNLCRKHVICLKMELHACFSPQVYTNGQL